MKEIRSFVSLRTTQLSTVLVACILLTCIELMRGDIPAAMIHIRYGIDMLNTSEDGSIIAIFFRHMSLLPIFTNQPLTSLPLITHGETCEAPENSSSFTVVQACINGLQYRAFRLARLREEFREAQVRGEEVKMVEPAWLREKQKELMAEISPLQRKFTEFRKIAPDNSKLELVSSLLEAQLLLLKVWLNSRDGCARCDSSTKECEEIIEIARKSLALSESFGLSFEVGLAPQLHFVFVNFRDLKLRLRILSLIQRICLGKHDILWDAEGIYRDCATILETSMEHGIKIGDLDASILDAVLRSPFYGRASHAYRDLAQWQAGYSSKDSGNYNLSQIIEQGSETGSDLSSTRSTPAARVDKFLYP